MTDGITWRAVLAEATRRLGDRAEARRIAEEASGREPAELIAFIESPVTRRVLAHFDEMVERRMNGEPLQYVLGRWGFRTLDVHVDRRVLIPRPETEIVVEHALGVIDELDARRVVDLGTGSGVIALSIAAERNRVSVWATDASSAALDVARANLAGLGMAGTRVQVCAGDWFAALPGELEGTIDVVVANPPYVATTDSLPPEVADWEPLDALYAGPRGLDAIAHILEQAPAWLASPGAVVLEIGDTHAPAVTELASSFDSTSVHRDLAGRPRVLIARRG